MQLQDLFSIRTVGVNASELQASTTKQHQKVLAFTLSDLLSEGVKKGKGVKTTR